MVQNKKKLIGTILIIVGIFLSPSILFLASRMSTGFDGLYATGFGPLEAFIAPLYAVPVVASILSVLKGAQLIKRSK